MYHNVRDSRGKFTSNINSKPKVYKTVKNQTKQKVNYVAIVLDRSGSMFGLRNDVVEQFNFQVRILKEESKKHNIKTYLTLVTFNHTVDKPVYINRPIDTIPSLNFSEYIPGGGTALLDAIGDASNILVSSVEYIDTDTSYLLINITDGEENESRRFSRIKIAEDIKARTSTDKWTFTALCPPYSVSTIENLGIPHGNIQAWEATRAGAQLMGQSLNLGTQSYYATRASGLSSTQSFFTPDLAGVTATALKCKLTDQSQDFLRLSVTESGRIDDFVAKTTGNPYVLGSGLYQLTKQENVQDYKTIVVQNKTTNELYSGVQNVRSLLKLPESGTIKIRPSLYTSEYVIFVQSTAPNRKLIQGTTMLLDKSRL